MAEIFSVGRVALSEKSLMRVLVKASHFLSITMTMNLILKQHLWAYALYSRTASAGERTWVQKQKQGEKRQLYEAHYLSFGFVFTAEETHSFSSVADKTSWTPIDFCCLINEACN